MSHGPDKHRWTTRDFEVLGWHDATIHELIYKPSAHQLQLDIDYILEWVSPVPGEVMFRFRIAPAWLIFENVHNLEIDIDGEANLQIDDVTRDEFTPATERVLTESWLWHVELHRGEISFRSSGFVQELRSDPQLAQTQSLMPSMRSPAR